MQLGRPIRCAVYRLIRGAVVHRRRWLIRRGELITPTEKAKYQEAYLVGVFYLFV